MLRNKNMAYSVAKNRNTHFEAEIFHKSHGLRPKKTMSACKKAPKFMSGPPLLFQQMVFIKTQPEEIINIVKPVIQRNVFLADPGVILCSISNSPNQTEGHGYHKEA